MDSVPVNAWMFCLRRPLCAGEAFCARAAGPAFQAGSRSHFLLCFVPSSNIYMMLPVAICMLLVSCTIHESTATKCISRDVLETLTFVPFCGGREFPGLSGSSPVWTKCSLCMSQARGFAPRSCLMAEMRAIMTEIILNP